MKIKIVKMCCGEGEVELQPIWQVRVHVLEREVMDIEDMERNEFYNRK